MQIKRILNKNVLSVMALVVCLCVYFVLALLKIDSLAANSCFNTLQDASNQVAGEVKTQIRHEQQQVKVISDLLAQHGQLNSDMVLNHLAAFQKRGLVSALAIVLPDNTYLATVDGAKFNNRKFDFALEKSRLPYISGVVASMDDPNDKYIYHAVKIERQGEVLGILYGFINLQDFAKHINLSFFDGNAQLFIADGETGDFLVDTWHKKLGNIFDGTILKRKVKDGYDFWQMKQDFVNNKEGHIAFWSNTAQEYFYSYYQPIGVNKWMVQLTVLESKAFANAIKIRKVVYFLGFVVLMSFLLCLQWLWRQAKKDMQLKEELSNTDVLTDLHNRNCYEQKLEHYAKHHKEGLCCLYLDVNGLHELNNTLGHEAGNEMLVYVANTLKTFFGRKHCYRIGGDEFVVFLTDCSPEEVAQRLQQCNESIESQNYHVSVGEAWLEQGQEMNDLVRIAESRMYEAKRAYYERGGNVAKARLMNQKLEQILLEKKDAETFLRTISSRFMGVYIVDTAADIARVIFKPSYFSELLDVYNDHFRPAMAAYIEEYVANADQNVLQELLDYEKLQKELQDKKLLKYFFTKSDGESVVLRIYAANGTDTSQTVWLFEKDVR